MILSGGAGPGVFVTARPPTVMQPEDAVCQSLHVKQSTWEANSIFGTETDTSPERYVFHYTSVERCAAIGFTGSVGLGRLTPMNDPRESQVRQVTTMRSGGPGDVLQVTDEERQAFEAELWRLRASVRLACFSADQTDGTSSERDDWRGYAHSRMWTQYAAGHTGVCLVFDRARLIDTGRAVFGKSFHCGAVTYVSGFDHALHDAELADFDQPNPGLHHRTKVIPSLFVKNRDWAAEFEFRLLVDEWDDSACLLPIAESLIGVALGVSFTPYHLPVIARLAETFGLDDRVAQLIVNCGVLQAWPARDRAGELRVWTDADTRLRNEIFDPEVG